jgi:hypothetical protein
MPMESEWSRNDIIVSRILESDRFLNLLKKK